MWKKMERRAEKRDGGEAGMGAAGAGGTTARVSRGGTTEVEPFRSGFRRTGTRAGGGGAGRVT